MPGHNQIAAPGEPACGWAGCRRPAGLGTSHVGEGPCLRHGGHSPAQRSHAVPHEPTPEPSPELREAERAAPLARRLTGSHDQGRPVADPLSVLGVVLASARRAGYPFEEAWAIGAEVALSYMSLREAREWWDTLNATERAWSDAYARRGSRLADLQC